MDGQSAALAGICLNAAYDGTLSFPDIIAKLIASGFEGYKVDYRHSTTTYYLADGGAVVLENHPSDVSVALRFDHDAIIHQIRWAQASPPDYSYGAFCTNMKAHGCAGYIVSFPGQRVLYFGRTAETHVEHFSQ